ncbi:MAG TPA: hypothetical protein VF937_05725 [Chloroflexota bacterium]
MKPSAGLATQYAPPLDLPFRFMATALVWIGVLALVYPWHTPLLRGSFYDPHLLTFVHVNTLGVIAATVFGASYQLLPVVLGIPIASVRLARLSWWLYLPALPLFLAGMAQGWLVPLALGGALLFGAVGLYVGIVVLTLRRATQRDVVFWHLAVAVTGLATAASLGLSLAFSKNGGFLGGWTLPILAAHATLMLGGWLTPMLMGVAYRLVGMFTLSEDRLRERWAWASLVAASGGAWMLAIGLLAASRPLLLLGSFGLLAGIALFGAQLLHLYRVRRRRQFDVHIPFAVTGAAFGLLSAGLLLTGLIANRSAADPIWVAAGWLAIAGWAETPIQGFLYKIGTFLTWLHRYAPLAGRQPVPRLEDLYDQRTAVAGWAAWSSGVALGGLAALAQIDLLSYLAAAGLSLGALLFLSNAVRVGARWRSVSVKPTTGVGLSSAASH